MAGALIRKVDSVNNDMRALVLSRIGIVCLADVMLSGEHL